MTKKLNAPREEILPEWEKILKDLDGIHDRAAAIGIPCALLIGTPDDGYDGMVVNEVRPDIDTNGALLVIDQSVRYISHANPGIGAALKVALTMAAQERMEEAKTNAH